MIKIATVCSGIGAPEMALRNIGVEHENVFACEINPYARKTYLANFTPNQMIEDMTKESWEGENLYSDIFCGGIPCQSFSLAGKRLGELDPRGLLFYDFYRYVKVQQPKSFIIENVKGLLSDAGGKTFGNWLQLLGRSENTHVNMFNHPDSLEYNLHWTVLNSKNFGVPQNRERVFIVGIRKDLPNTFRFPIGKRLTKRLKDILEKDVDEKYYLSDKMINYLYNANEKHKFLGNGFMFKPRDEDGIASCITARCFKQGCDDNYIQDEIQAGAIRGRCPENPKSRVTGLLTEQTLEINNDLDCANTLTTVQKDNIILMKLGNLPGAFESRNRVYSADGLSPTITAIQGGGHEPIIQVDENTIIEHRGHKNKDPKFINNGIVPTLRAESHGHESKIFDKQRIRRLTPLECFRLQGFPDSFIKPCSDSQTYKQAGNSMTTFTMQAIIENLLPTVEDITVAESTAA